MKGFHIALRNLEAAAIIQYRIAAMTVCVCFKPNNPTDRPDVSDE
jgi:hypothetical protein